MNLEQIKEAAQNCLIIGITGAPASGKSWLAGELSKSQKSSTVINLDDYLGAIYEIPSIIDGYIDNGRTIIVEGCALCEVRDITFDLLITVEASDEVRHAVYSNERTTRNFGIASDLYAANQMPQNVFIKTHKRVCFYADADRTRLPLPTQSITIANFFEVAARADFADHCEALLYGNVSHEARLDLIGDARAFAVVDKGNIDSAKATRNTIKGLRIETAATGKSLKQQVDAVGKMLLDKTRSIGAIMETAENQLSAKIQAAENEIERIGAEKRAAKAQAQAEAVQRQKDCVIFGIPKEYWQLPAAELDAKIEIGKKLFELEQAQKQAQATADAAELAEFRRLKAEQSQHTETIPPPPVAIEETYFCTFRAPQSAANAIRDFAAAIGVVVCFE